MHDLPLSGVSNRALQAYLRLPDLGPRAPRAALDDALGVGPSSVTRYLQEWLSWRLVLRVAHGAYAFPRSPTRRLLLAEPDPYHREVLLLDDAFRDDARRAFACVPVRDALRMELPHAILVLAPGGGSGKDPPQVARMGLADPVRFQDVPVPSDASPPVAFARTPCAAPAEALALLASTGDADLLAAAKEAAPHVGTTVKEVLAVLRRLKVEPTPGVSALPHVVRHPAWLSGRVRSAAVTALRRASRAALEGGTP